MFQSPRSGKFESNAGVVIREEYKFDPSFNPLDRGNLNQILSTDGKHRYQSKEFQSPRSGKFESNKAHWNSLEIYEPEVSIP